MNSKALPQHSSKWPTKSAASETPIKAHGYYTLSLLIDESYAKLNKPMDILVPLLDEVQVADDEHEYTRDSGRDIVDYRRQVGRHTSSLPPLHMHRITKVFGSGHDEMHAEDPYRSRGVAMTNLITGEPRHERMTAGTSTAPCSSRYDTISVRPLRRAACNGDSLVAVPPIRAFMTLGRLRISGSRSTKHSISA